ncbi:MAG: GntR family [Pseudomonadota bacterium]|jgi:GntR family transcriptional regulator
MPNSHELLAPQRSPSSARTGAPRLFEQVRDTLRREILRGTWPAESRLPSESELIERFGVSRITVRQAIGELQAHGLVQTINGKGSFVARPDRGVAQSPLVGVLEAMRKRGFDARGELVSCKPRPAPAWVATELKIPEGSPMGTLTVRRRCDDQPFAIGTTWGPPAFCEAIARCNLVEHDVAAIIAGDLGIRNARTRVRVCAETASARIARSLNCDVGRALLVVYTTSFDFEGLPTSCGITHGLPEWMDYRVTLRG